MNAFLSVSLLKMPVSNLEDIHRLKYRLLMWQNDVSEEYLRCTSRQFVLHNIASWLTFLEDTAFFLA